MRYVPVKYTGKNIHVFDWKVLPIDDEVIAQVESLAADEKQPVLIAHMTLFEWAPGVPTIYIFGEKEIDEHGDNDNDNISAQDHDLMIADDTKHVHDDEQR